MTKESNKADNREELIYANGINGSTGAYLTPELNSNELANYIEGVKPPDYQDKLQERENREDDLGLSYGVDPKNLAETGWAVIYAAGVSSEVKEALSPLVNLRRADAGDLFREYIYRGERSREFLEDNDVSIAGPAEPKEMPYYLLLVGSPEEISYDFQVELDVDRAVGRIYFDTVEEYDNYARSVVAAEKGEVRRPRRATFFGVQNEADNATRLSTEMLVEPLYQHFTDRLTNGDRELKWDINAYLREEASRSQLERLLGGDAAETPALLFTASHGLGFDQDDDRQMAHQGALLCSDWKLEPRAIPEEVYLAGEHIAGDAQLHGLIGFFFACYGAGTPSHDEFMRRVEGQPEQIAPNSFVAGLPRRMLSHPRGGALAVIGHVERAWTYSFKKIGESQAHRGVFDGTLAKLFDGYPIGDAFDVFNGRHASASVQLASLLKDRRRSLVVSDLDLIQMWMVNNDARYYVILGDPAVRLCVSEEAEEEERPSTIELQDIDLAVYRPGYVPPSQPEGEESEVVSGGPEITEEEVASVPALGDEGESLGIVPDELKTQLKSALQNMARQISSTLQDVSRLEVLTYLSDEELEKVYQDGQFSAEAKLHAVTLIELDGKIKNLISDHKAESEEEGQVATAEAQEQLLNLHRQMVQAAQANRANYFKVLAETAVTLLNTRL